MRNNAKCLLTICISERNNQSYQWCHIRIRFPLYPCDMNTLEPLFPVDWHLPRLDRMKLAVSVGQTFSYESVGKLWSVTRVDEPRILHEVECHYGPVECNFIFREWHRLRERNLLFDCGSVGVLNFGHLVFKKCESPLFVRSYRYTWTK